MEPNLILTGFMGTGKTTVGQLIAQRLGRQFVDTDQWIEERAGKSVAAIFAEDGEDRFRAWEAEACEALSEPRGLIIATCEALNILPQVGATIPVLQNTINNTNLAINSSQCPKLGASVAGGEGK